MAEDVPDLAPGGVTVLVVEDDPSSRMVLESFLHHEGHRVLAATDGLQAVELNRRERPDLVLMDVFLPEMDGLEATRRIIADTGDDRPQVVIMSAASEPGVAADGLALADDFIRKPFDFPLLGAKLGAHVRLARGRKVLREQQQRIERLHDAMRRENEVAAHVMRRVLAHTELPDNRFLKYRVLPSSLFSGDMVLARRSPSGRLYILLADAVGHGLPAALNIVPLFFPFDAMSRKGCPLATIVRELNLRVRDLLPVDRFVAATLLAVDQVAGSIEVWNGGNPPVLLLDHEGRLVRQVDSMEMALGLNDDRPALFEPLRLPFAAGARVLACSDGIWENPAFAGEDTAARIVGHLAAPSAADSFGELFRLAVEAGQADDLSAVMVVAKAAEARESVAGVPALGARLSLQLGPDALATGDALDSVLDMARALGMSERFPAFPGVLAELFRNALDYGVLGLDGCGKYESSQAYQEYAERRDELLSRLGEGFVAVEAAPDYIDGRRMLRLRVADSGMGFDWAAEQLRGADDGPEAGRGLQMVRRCAVRLDFNSQGSEAIVLLAEAEVA